MKTLISCVVTFLFITSLQAQSPLSRTDHASLFDSSSASFILHTRSSKPMRTYLSARLVAERYKRSCILSPNCRVISVEVKTLPTTWIYPPKPRYVAVLRYTRSTGNTIPLSQ
jgi:hypothetical protein